MEIASECLSKLAKSNRFLLALLGFMLCIVGRMTKIAAWETRKYRVFPSNSLTSASKHGRVLCLDVYLQTPSPPSLFKSASIKTTQIGQNPGYKALTIPRIADQQDLFPGPMVTAISPKISEIHGTWHGETSVSSDPGRSSKQPSSPAPKTQDLLPAVGRLVPSCSRGQRPFAYVRHREFLRRPACRSRS